MIEHVEHEGFWWLPGREAERLFGTLRLGQGRPELKVAGNFGHQVISQSEGVIAYSFDLEDRPRILGITTDGKAVTLEDCSSQALVLPVPGIPTAVGSCDLHARPLPGGAARFIPRRPQVRRLLEG